MLYFLVVHVNDWTGSIVPINLAFSVGFYM